MLQRSPSLSREWCATHILLLLLFTNIAKGLLSGYDFQSIEKYKKAVGGHHLRHSLPTDSLIARAVHHTHIANTQRCSSNGKEEEHLYHYVTCSHDAHREKVSSWMQSRGIIHYSSYYSAAQRMHCYYTFLSQQHVSQLRSDQQVTLQLLEPVPDVLKMDASFIALQHSTIQQRFASSSSSSISLLPQHPILQDIELRKPIALSIIFVRTVSKLEQQQLVAGWLSQPHNSATSRERNFWLSGGDYNERTGQMMPAFETATLSEPDGIINAYYSQQYHSMLNQAWEEWAAVPEGHAAACKFDQLLVQHNKQETHIRLPATWLSSLQHSSSGDSGSSYLEYKHCLFTLLLRMMHHSSISRLALSRPMHVQNNYARSVIQNGLNNGDEHFTDAGLTGKNVVIGVSDTGIDETSCFFRDADNGQIPRSLDETNTTIDYKYRKIVQYVAFSGSSGDYKGGHGTHVAGTLAGYCAFENEKTLSKKSDFKGMAPDAKLAFLDIGIDDKDEDLVVPSDFSEGLFPPARAAGAHIHSNSWGGGYLYDGFCLSTDKYLYEQDDFLAIFAAGNAGAYGDQTVMSPALSKNAIAVACSNTGHGSDSIAQLASFSSKGPAPDGRLKPDIAAPGSYLLSALARDEGSTGHSCETTSKQGTSMSTPVVAGNAALIVQYFEDAQFWSEDCNQAHRWCLRGAFTPSGSLLKAMILQSGIALTKHTSVSLHDPPDSYQGYGRMNLQKIIPFSAATSATAHLRRQDTTASPLFNLYVDQSHLFEMTEAVYEVAVEGTSFPLKVTLSWFDPPNEVFAGKFLLHDLDLLLVDPEGQVFYGNSHGNAGDAVVGASRDEVNTNEQLTIDEPISGTWTVRVQAKQLSEVNYQNYSLVITTTGAVVEPALNEDTGAVTAVPLSASLLEQCQVSGGRPRSEPFLQLLVSAWSRVKFSGWRNGDTYTIVSTDAVADVAGSSSSISYTNKLSSNAYEGQSACLPSGCYNVSLQTTESSFLGTQVDIAQCGVFLASMVPHSHFCIDPAISTTIGDSSTLLFEKGACSTVCERAEHFLLPLLLREEYEGAGWSGSYYMFFQIPSNHPHHSSSNSDQHFISSTYGGGHMEWGFETVKTHCLPANRACYQLQLSVVSNAALVDTKSYSKEEIPEYPELLFANALLMVFSEDSGVYELMDEPCPYELNSTATAATVCIDDGNSSIFSPYTNVSFYMQNSLTTNFGQVGTAWNDLVAAHDPSNLELLGVCSILKWSSTELAAAIGASDNEATPTLLPTIISTSDQPSTAMPSTASPTTATTAAPTDATAPTAAPSDLEGADIAVAIQTIYGSHNFSCFSDCVGFPDLSTFATDIYNTCLFFIDIYGVCTTFSVAYGTCAIPECASDCRIEDWCYFASGTTISCPYDNAWSGLSSDAAAIAAQCTESMMLNSSAVPTGDDEINGGSGSSDSSGSISEGTKVAIAVTVIVAMSVIIGAVAYWCSARSSSGYSRSAGGSGDPSMDNSTTIIFNPAHLNNRDLESSNYTSTEGVATVSGGGGGSNSNRSGILSRGAGFIKNRVLPKSKKPKTVEYEMVQSPFSITGEEDDDNDSGEGDNGGGRVYTQGGQEDEDEVYDEMEFEDARQGTDSSKSTGPSSS